MKLFKTTSLRQLLQKEPSELSLANFIGKEEENDTWYDSTTTLDFQCSSSSSMMDDCDGGEEASVVTTTTTSTITTTTLSSCLKQSEGSTTTSRRRRGRKQQQRRRVRLDAINVLIHEDNRDLTDEEIQAQWSTRVELDERCHQFRALGEAIPLQTVETIHALYEGCQMDDTAKVNDLVERMSTVFNDDVDILGMARRVSVVHQGLKDRRQKLQELVRSEQQSRKGVARAMRPLRGERLRLKCEAITQHAQCFARCLAQAQSCS